MIPILILWNIAVFSIYGIDKWKAIHNKWRISENFLIISAFLMGSLGAIVGMNFFRHKTKHIKFRLLLPLALLFNLGVIYIAKRYIPSL